MYAHPREGDVCSVRSSENAVLAHLQQPAQVQEVFDILERVVGAEIDSLGDQSIVTFLRGRHVEDPGRWRIVDQAYRLGIERVDFGA